MVTKLCDFWTLRWHWVSSVYLQICLDDLTDCICNCCLLPFWYQAPRGFSFQVVVSWLYYLVFNMSWFLTSYECVVLFSFWFIHSFCVDVVSRPFLPGLHKHTLTTSYRVNVWYMCLPFIRFYCNCKWIYHTLIDGHGNAQGSCFDKTCYCTWLTDEA